MNNSLLAATEAEPGLFDTAGLTSHNVHIVEDRLREDLLVVLKLVLEESSIVLVCLIVYFLHEFDCFVDLGIVGRL